MRSTFMGLEASKKGLFVQQSALYTTGHNISNANTEGYTRQRVNMSATPGFPHPGLNSPTYPGHLGTGVEATSIQRMRDEFTDRQFRQETNKLGYWDTTLKAINEMEDILSEPSEFGINQAFTDLWRAFQDLADKPIESAARKVAIARAESLAEAFNYNYTQLETIQGNLGNEIDVTTKEINTILEKISQINEQVQTLEPNGYVTNDLYDARDLLVDELNQYLPVSIERVPSGGNASPVAEGSLTITFSAGGRNIVLVEANKFGNVAFNHANGQITGAMDQTTNQYALFENMTVTGATGQQETYVYGELEGSHAARGKMLALIDAYGHTVPDRNLSNGIYPDMMNDLNKVAEEFVKVFNAAHTNGFTLAKGNVPSALGGEFFNPTTPPAAKSMTVKQDIINNPNLVAASSREGEEGNGRWAMELSNLQYAIIALSAPPITVPGATNQITPAGDLGGFTFQGFYTGMIGDLAVLGNKAETNQFNSQTQMITISNNRSSMNSVSLDEEMTNMITFQQAYNANARMITVVDEILEKIINGMGRVGL